MEKMMVAGAIVIVIAIVVVAAYALTMTGKANTSTTVLTTVPANVSQTTTTITPSTSFATGCTPGSGFSCSNASMTTYGQLTLSLTESANTTLYDVHVACIASGSSTTAPLNASSWYALTSLGTTKQSNYSGTTILPGTAENIANLQCYNTTGLPFSTTGNQVFTGLLLLNYTASTAAVNASNPWITATAATLNLTSQ